MFLFGTEGMSHNANMTESLDRGLDDCSQLCVCLGWDWRRQRLSPLQHHTHTNTLTAARDWRLCAREPSKGKTGAHYTFMWIERKKGKNFSLCLNNLQVCGLVFSPRVFIW